MTRQTRYPTIHLPDLLHSRSKRPSSAMTTFAYTAQSGTQRWHLWRPSTSVIGCLSCPQHGDCLAPSREKLSIGRRCTGWQRAHKEIISLGDQPFVTSEQLAQSSLHTIPHHRGTYGLSHRQPEADDAFPPVVSIHGKVFGSQPRAMTMTACEVGGSGETLIFPQALVHSVSDGQPGAALLTTSLQN
jgi:hypothetical protein